MTPVLTGLRIVEGSAFVAAPLGGMTLAQLGADVIRFDAIGGGLDFNRWPVTDEGVSLFWAGLNKGKRSIQVDLRSPEGREIVTEVIVAPGPEAGIFLSNFPEGGWLSDATLRARRNDMIYVNIIGNPDESTAVDYTVNPSSGFAYATGPTGSMMPTNHVLPAWDTATGLTSAVGLLAAERYRSRTGEGQLVKVSLTDVAFAMVANLGYMAQAQLTQADRTQIGNDLYGAFGRDFPTKDGRRVMVVAISLKQWQSLADATGITPHLPAIEKALGVDLRKEGDRFGARDAIAAFVAPFIANHSLNELRETFDEHGVCWGPYQTFTQLVKDDPRASIANPMFSKIDQPGVGRVLAPGSPLAFSEVDRETPAPAPRLGQHTDEVLGEVLGLSDHEIGLLHDKGIVAGVAGVSATDTGAAPTLQSLGLEAEAASPLSGELVERLAVTLDRPVPTDRLPITWHWAFFVPMAGSASLGADGHPRRPAGRLSEHYPRRMFAGGRLRSAGGLRADVPTVRTSEIASAEEKSGRSGDLLLVTVRHRYAQAGDTVLEEEQDLVYRPASSAPTPLPEAGADAPAAGTWGRTLTPVRPLLFRYSALTFNAHRIHYDLPYASGEEGYPDLVVHGPLTATLLADLAVDGLGRPLETFRFRASAPLFADQPVVLRGEPSDGGASLEAVRVDGAVAMTAEAG